MENLFETLNIENQENLITYITNYGSTFYQPLNADLSHILRFWAYNKADLYKMFGNQLMVSEKVCVEADVGTLCDIVESRLIYPCVQTKASQFITAVRNLPHDAIEPHWDGWYDVTARKVLASNRLEKDIIIHLPNGKDYKAYAGSKVSKVLSKIAGAFDIPNYEEFRIAHSMCLNEKKLSGNLTLSIHPLDFLTMSDNDCGWSSCMRLRSNCNESDRAFQGEYSQGPVEMMNSPCVVIAYLEAEEPMIIKSRDGKKSFEWNNKKWRSLFIVNKDIICPISGYPYDNRDLDLLCLKKLKELATKNLGYTYYDEIISEDGCIHKFDSEKRLNIQFNTHYMYCDIDSIANRDIYLNPRFEEEIKEDSCMTHTIFYSGESECIICGQAEKIYYDCAEDAIVNYQPACIGCAGIVRCEECEELVGIDNAIYDNGSWYCTCCHDNAYETCPICGVEYPAEHIWYTEVSYIFDDDELPKGVSKSPWGDKTIVYYGSIHICNECLEDDELMTTIFGAPIRNYRIDAKALAKSYRAGNKMGIKQLGFCDATIDYLLSHFPEETNEAEDS